MKVSITYSLMLWKNCWGGKGRWSDPRFLLRSPTVTSLLKFENIWLYMGAEVSHPRLSETLAGFCAFFLRDLN